MSTAKDRISARFQTLMREYEKNTIAKEALKMSIKERNEIADLVEPMELKELMNRGGKISKKGTYRMGGKVKQLSANQMDIYKNRYAESGEIKKIHRAPGGQRTWPLPDGGQGNWDDLPVKLQHKIYKARELTIPAYANPTGTTVTPSADPITPSELVADENLPEPDSQDGFFMVVNQDLGTNLKTWDEMTGEEKGSHYRSESIEIPTVDEEQTVVEDSMDIDTEEETTTAPKTKKSTKSGYNKDIDGFKLLQDDKGDYTLEPAEKGELLETLLGPKDGDKWKSDSLGKETDIGTYKGIKSYDKASNTIEFEDNEAGAIAKQLYNTPGVGPDNFTLKYLEAWNQESKDTGTRISFKDLYKYTDAIGLTGEKGKYLKKAGKDSKYGAEHEKLIENLDINNLFDWDKQGRDPNWTITEAEKTEDVADANNDGGGGAALAADGGGGDNNSTTDDGNSGNTEEETEPIQNKLTAGEKIGIATGALGRIGGIAAALSNKPDRAWNAYQGVSERAEGTMDESIRKSRIGFEQTEDQIKSQGNLARGIAANTSNSWSQRYAAALGSQRITDDSLIKNRNTWEKLYGNLKGQQAQIQMKGDSMEAQGHMQVQDWFQRDKDSYLAGLGQEAQNLTNFGASMSSLANMKKLRQQQLDILANYGTYRTLNEIETGIYRNVHKGSQQENDE